MKRLCLFSLVIISCIAAAYVLKEDLIPEKPIVIVIPSYNNSKWYEANLSSVSSQKYSNYRVVYIDDCSSDNTYELVVNKVKESELANRTQIIHNSVNQGALANIYAACHAADDNEIIITLDGDDALAHEHVLSRINRAYQDPNIWLTYGQYKVYPENCLGICNIIPPDVISANAYRAYEWKTSHIRTFYAWLFKRIKKEDLMHDNLFFPVTWDMAMMFPMLEMSGGRFTFINEIMYIYNCANPLNDYKLRYSKQAYCEKVIRNAPRYQPLLAIITKK